MTTLAAMEKLRKKGSRWYGRWIDEFGKQRERSLSSDKRAATKMLAELQRNADLARVGIEGTIEKPKEVEPLIVQYIAHLRRCDRSAKHVRDTETGLRLVCEGVEVIRMLSPVWLGQRVDALKKERAARTVNKLIGYLRSMLAWGERTGAISRSPLGAAVPKVAENDASKAKKRHRLTVAEVALLQAGADDHGPIGDMVAVALGSGFRKEEAARLRWCDFDAKAGTLTARETKNGADRTNVIPSDLVERLRAIRSRRALEAGKVPDPDAHILLRANGEPWTPTLSYLALRDVVEKTDGIQMLYPDGTSIDWHAIRHTVATALGAAGFSEFQLQRFMGWKSAAMARVYVELDRIRTDLMAQALPWGASNAEEKQA